MALALPQAILFSAFLLLSCILVFSLLSSLPTLQAPPFLIYMQPEQTRTFVLHSFYLKEYVNGAFESKNWADQVRNEDVMKIVEI